MEHDHENREITIETLSSPPIKIPSAPLPKRAAAALIDLVVVGAVWGISSSASTSGMFNPSIRPLSWTCLFAFTYYFLTEGLFAATPGKFVLKLRVMGKDGELCGFSESFKRNILRFVDWLPALYAVGVVSVLLSEDRQRFGDKLAGTIVSVAPARDSTPPPAPFLFH
jgi:uncharacterized RDD family membrane protein YckC